MKNDQMIMCVDYSLMHIADFVKSKCFTEKETVIERSLRLGVSTFTIQKLTHCERVSLRSMMSVLSGARQLNTATVEFILNTLKESFGVGDNFYFCVSTYTGLELPIPEYPTFGHLFSEMLSLSKLQQFDVVSASGLCKTLIHNCHTNKCTQSAEVLNALFWIYYELIPHLPQEVLTSFANLLCRKIVPAGIYFMVDVEQR